jgi:hypothetical protein
MNKCPICKESLSPSKEMEAKLASLENADEWAKNYFWALFKMNSLIGHGNIESTMYYLHNKEDPTSQLQLHLAFMIANYSMKTDMRKNLPDETT